MVGQHGVEVMAAVGEVAEAVGGALEWRHERKVAKDVSREWDWAEVESGLDVQRRENERLRAKIHMYEQAFQEFHKQKVESGGSVDRSMGVYEQLKRRVASLAFLDKLKPYQGDGASTSRGTTVLQAEDGSYVKADVGDPSSWLFCESDTAGSRDIKEVQDELESDGYVMVNEEDIVDSIASYLARYISSVPQAKNLTPKELQQAMTEAFTNAEKKGRLRSLYSTGKFLYTVGSWGATALSIHKHPMAIRAASMAVWTSCCLILKLIA